MIRAVNSNMRPPNEVGAVTVVGCAPMMSFWSRVGVVTLVLVWSAAGRTGRCEAQAAAAGDAASRAQAKEQFEAGVAAYEAGRFDDALTYFQEAYRIKPHPLVRVNIANCYDRLNQPLPAIFHFERFLEESEPSSAHRNEVAEALRVLRGKVAEVTLRISPDGASVTIDSGERRMAPILEPIQLEAGTHVVEVAFAGHQTVKRDLVLEGGQRTSLEITLEREAVEPPVVAAAPMPPPEPAPVPEPNAAPHAEARPVPVKDPQPAPTARAPAPVDRGGKPLLPTAGWITAGAGAAMVIGALITGQLALSAEADFERARDTAVDIAGATPLERQAAYEDALQAADRADAFALASDLMLVAGIASVGATVYFAIDHHSAYKSSASSATLTVAPTGVALTGVF